MTTEETVKRLIHLVKESKNVQAEEELYAENVISYEQDGSMTKGKSAVIEKTKGAGSAFDSMQSHIGSAWVAKDSFILEFDLRMTPKGSSKPMEVKEFGFYKTENGMVVEEHFYMQPLAI